MKMIEIKDLTISFGEETIYQDFSLSVSKGEKLAITGESGKGKSTLLNVLAGFIPNFEGHISIDGLPLGSNTIQEIRSKIACPPQDTAIKFDKVEELFFAPFEFSSNKNNRPSEEKIGTLLQAFDLSPKILNKKLHEISGGQKQRIILASCLSLHKPILLLDEPTSALDKRIKEQVSDYTLSRSELTIIAVPHDDYWVAHSDQVLLLE